MINNNQINKKRKKFMFLSAITVILLTIIVCIVVMSANKAPWKYDMTNGRIFTLTEKTRTVLKDLDGTIKIAAVYPTGRSEQIVDSLLNEYQKASEKIEVEYIDAEKEPSKLSKYNLGEVVSVVNGTLIIEYGERVKLINNDDLFTNDTNGNTFYGESELTGAIRYVTSEDLPIVYFTQGHGEIPTGTDLSEAVSYLTLDAYETKNVVILEEKIPEDTEILAIISPQMDIDQSEKDLIKGFLDKGGKLLLTLDPFLNKDMEPFENLNEIVTQYGIDITNNYVVEEDASYHLPTGNSYLIPRYGAHEITQQIGESKKLVVLPLARGLGAVEYEETTVKRDTILLSSDKSWARNNIKIESKEKTEKDISGPIALGFAATKGNTDTQNYSSKVVVLGDSDFIKDGNFKVQANSDLFANSMNWLLGGRTSEIIAGKVINSDTMIVRGNTFIKLVTVCCVILPLISFMGGLAVWYMRRNR